MPRYGIYKYSWFILFCFFLPSLHAQEMTLMLQHYSVNEGLSHRQVNAIHQDQQGFVWVGTEYGLNRFDGYQFKWWTKEENGLFRNAIGAITEDAAGKLWICYSNQYRDKRYKRITEIDLLDTRTGSIHSFGEAIYQATSIELQDIYADFRVTDSNRTIYMGTADTARIISYAPEKGFHVTRIDGYQSFFPLVYTKEGHFWGIANENVLLKVDEKGLVLQSVVFEENLYYNLVIYDGQFFWLQQGEEQKTFYFQKVDGISGEKEELDLNVFGLSAEKAKYGYRRLRYDAVNQLTWNISRSKLVNVFSLKENAPQAIGLNEVFEKTVKEGKIGLRAFHVSPDGMVWFGGDFGLTNVRLRQNPFTLYLHQSEPANSQNHIACRGMLKIEEQLMVATDRHGLHQINLNDFSTTNLIEYDKLKFGGWTFAFDLLEKNDQLLWSAGDQILQLDISKQPCHIETLGKRGAQNLIWSMYQDSTERIWIGTANGLEYFDLHSDRVYPFKNIHPIKHFSTEKVTNIIEDRSAKFGFVQMAGFLHLTSKKE